MAIFLPRVVVVGFLFVQLMGVLGVHTVVDLLVVDDLVVHVVVGLLEGGEVMGELGLGVGEGGVLLG